LDVSQHREQRVTHAASGFRFIHCADLHLDSPFEGLHAVDPQVGQALRDATFRAFDNVIDLAVRERVGLIVIAGDIYDGADRSLKAQLRFRDALARAADAGIPCCVIHGNHDPLDGWQIELAMPSGSRRFDGAAVETFTIARDGQPLVDVYGLSYATRDVSENLARRFRRDGQAPLAIGLLHCNVGGDPHHDNYAPCSMEDLADAGMDYWALGHVHQRRVVREASPTIVYSGNVQGRSVRELGPRGCYLVSVDEGGRCHPEFIATDAVRWFQHSLDISSYDQFDPLLDALNDLREQVRSDADGRAAVVRLQLTGRGDLHALLRREATAEDLAAQLRDGEPDRPDFVWVESLRVATRPAVDVEQRRGLEDFVGDFLRAAESLRTAEQAPQAVRDVLLRRPECKRIAAQLDALPDEDLLSILDRAEVMGLDYLLD
jgi:DNA repair exonuclease SbcCD nuclease subunit